MIRLLATTACLAVFSASAFAADATCSKSDKSKFKPEADLTAMLAKDGMKVTKIKTEKGCYEAYVIAKDGKKMNMGFNAETFEPVKNAEAGEQ